MRLAKRITASIASILVLQLWLLGTGTLCAARGLNDTGRRGHDSRMSVREQHAGEMAGMANAPAAAAPSGCHATGDSDTCVPWTARCGSMSVCTMTMSLPTPATALVSPPRLVQDQPAFLTMAADLTIAPELPPPRA
jgi:hypothetical protein